ncbi:MAG: chitobiase/beta-hexosaminidase C-terminal domain-containing protein [Paludibacteraceae bacterium]
MITINYNVTITSGTSANNSYITINSVDFFAASLSSVPTPAFYAYDDVDDVENNGFYTSNLMVEIECDDYEAVIRYTTDGTEPTAESDEYTDGILFTNEFVTLRAKAFKGEDESYEATANYYHNSSLSVPYTTSEAITLYNALGNVSDIYVEGVVTGIPSYSASSSSSNYNITDGETILYIYKGTAEETSGLADIANLVEGDKVTVNGDITKYGSTIELNSGNTIVKWTENTNPVLSCVESVSFGNISSLVSPVPTKTLVVTAKNLTEDIAVTLSEDAAFVLDKSEFDVRNGGTIVITPVLTVGDNTATLTLTSGETSATVTLTATIKQAYTISWSVNGEVTSTSQVIDGDNLVLPASPEAPNDCASKVFVGWATTATVAADGIGIVFVDAATTAEKDATYYAVFATATESDESVTTYEKLTSAENFEDGTYLLAGYVATSTTYYAYTGQVSTNTYAGSVEVTVANDVIATKPETALEITITTNAEGAFSIYDGTSWLSAPSDNALTFNDKDTMDWKLTEELKIQSVGQTDRFLQFNGGANPKRFACYKGTMSNPYLFKKVVSPVMDYSEYTTTCDDTPSAIDNAAVETSAVKSIENGQLVILRDGVKYNAMGVRLQ